MAKSSEKKLKITLVKSTIGAIPKQVATVKSMGFKKLNSSVELPDNSATRGQIQQIRHLVKVEEISSQKQKVNGIRSCITYARVVNSDVCCV